MDLLKWNAIFYITIRYQKAKVRRELEKQLTQTCERLYGKLCEGKRSQQDESKLMHTKSALLGIVS